MGRKGAKGSAKGADKPDADEEEQGEQHQQPSQVAAPSTSAAAPSHDGGSGSDGEDDDNDASGPETRSRMLKRHKAEVLAHKKAVQRLGKKSKDELAKLNKEIEDRHAAELKALAAQGQGQQQQQQAPPAAAARVAEDLADLAVDGKKPSKAQKRREKQEKEEAERNARIAEEEANMGPSNRRVEEEQLASILKPIGLQMKDIKVRLSRLLRVLKDIKADGHCLYRAVEDQLQQRSGSSAPVPSFLDLRAQAAAHMLAHPDDFIPFVYDDEKEGDPAGQLASYCNEMASTARWGGQLELGALAEVLKSKIEVHAVGMPLVTLGDQYPERTLRLCYLRHAFGLGEHYNSVEPAAAQP